MIYRQLNRKGIHRQFLSITLIITITDLKIETNLKKNLISNFKSSFSHFILEQQKIWVLYPPFLNKTHHCRVTAKST